MLADHDLRVETAESAEAALEFLALHRPDVIFMDHMMPGMDGFQAVKAIKENPATATIPVMMYTSQSGELYVGQARALGAVGVLPKQIKPVGVREVLRSLHLLPATWPGSRVWNRSMPRPTGPICTSGCRKCWLIIIGRCARTSRRQSVECSASICQTADRMERR